MSLSGKPCSCGGRNKNCKDCGGSGLAPARPARKKRGKGPALSSGGSVVGGWMNAPRRERAVDATDGIVAPPTRMRCALCGKKITEGGSARHAEAVHFPQLPRGRVVVEVLREPTTTQTKAPVKSPRKKATRRSPPPS